MSDTDLAVLGIDIDATKLDDGKRKLDDFSKGASGAQKATDLLKEAVKRASEVLATVSLAHLIQESTQLAIVQERLSVALRITGANAGYLSGELEKYTAQVKDASFTQNEALKIVTRMAVANIDLSKSQQLAAAAQDAAAASGRDATEVADTFTNAIVTGMERSVKSLGIVADFESAYQRKAASINVTKEALTEYQLVQARTDAILEASKQVLGAHNAVMETASGQAEELGQEWEDLKTHLGQPFVQPVTETLWGMRAALAGINEQFANGNVDTFASKVEGFLIAITKPLGIGYLIEDLDTLVNKNTEASKAINDLNKENEDVARILTGSIERTNKLWDDARGEWAKRDREQFQEARKSAEDYIETLTNELITLRDGEVAARLRQNRIEASKAPTDALKNSILDLGDAWVLAFNNDKIDKGMDNVLAKLDAMLKSSDSINRITKMPEILSIKTGETQGHGSGQQKIDDNPLPFQVKDAEAYLSILQRVQEQTQTAARSMADSFGKVGQAVGDLSSIMSAYDVNRQAIEVKRLADIEKYGDKSKANAQAEKENASLSLQYQGDLLGASKEFFDHKSRLYKALNAAETAYRAIQLAGAVQNIVSQATETTATVANAGTQSSAWGIAAFARTLASLPFPYNLAAGAAVIAALASVGVAISGGGSGATPGATDAADRQKAAGTGSVLGDATAKSDSISKAIESVSRNSNEMLEYNSRMANSLRSIDENISSFTAVIARNIGLNTGGTFDTAKLGLGTSIGAPSFLTDPFGLGHALGLDSKHTTKSLQDFGLDFASQSLSSLVAGDVLAKVYQQILTSSSTNVLGVKVSSSKSVSTVTSSITEELAQQVSQIVGSLKDGVVSAASVLGLTGANAVIDSFKVNLGKVSFEGLSGQEIQDELSGIFSKLGDQLSVAVIPDLTKFQQVGEGAFATLARLAREYEVVDTTLSSMGLVFASVGIKSIGARDSLIKLSGGMDDFTSQARFFVDNFLTPAQRLAPITKAVSDEMARLNESQVKTKEQFYNLVQSLDLTTNNGQTLYTSLMKVAPAFAEVADAAQTAFESLIGSITDQINALISSSQDSANAARATAQAYASVSQQLNSTLQSIVSTQSSNPLAILRRQFSSAASSSDLGSLQSLPGLASQLIGAARTQSPTLASFREIRNQITSGLRDAGVVADTASSQAAYQAKLYDVQTQILQNAKLALSQDKVNTDLLRQEVSQLGTIGDLITQSASGTVDAVSQTNNLTVAGSFVQEKSAITLSSVLGALSSIATEIEQQTTITALLVQDNASRAVADTATQTASNAAQSVSAMVQRPLSNSELAASLGEHGALFTGKGNSPIQDVQQAIILGLPVSDSSFAQAGITSSDVARLRAAGVKAYAAGGFASGLRIVGENGPELENSGPSYITGNAALKNMFDLTPLIDEMRAQRTINNKMAVDIRKLRDLFTQITLDGNGPLPVETRTEAA